MKNWIIKMSVLCVILLTAESINAVIVKTNLWKASTSLQKSPRVYDLGEYNWGLKQANSNKTINHDYFIDVELIRLNEISQEDITLRFTLYTEKDLVHPHFKEKEIKDNWDKMDVVPVNLYELEVSNDLKFRAFANEEEKGGDKIKKYKKEKYFERKIKGGHGAYGSLIYIPTHMLYIDQQKKNEGVYEVTYYIRLDVLDSKGNIVTDKNNKPLNYLSGFYIGCITTYSRQLNSYFFSTSDSLVIPSGEILNLDEYYWGMQQAKSNNTINNDYFLMINDLKINELSHEDITLRFTIYTDSVLSIEEIKNNWDKMDVVPVNLYDMEVSSLLHFRAFATGNEKGRNEKKKYKEETFFERKIQSGKNYSGYVLYLPGQLFDTFQKKLGNERRTYYFRVDILDNKGNYFTTKHSHEPKNFYLGIYAGRIERLPKYLFHCNVCKITDDISKKELVDYPMNERNKILENDEEYKIGKQLREGMVVPPDDDYLVIYPPVDLGINEYQARFTIWCEKDLRHLKYQNDWDNIDWNNMRYMYFCLYNKENTIYKGRPFAFYDEKKDYSYEVYFYRKRYDKNPFFIHFPYGTLRLPDDVVEELNKIKNPNFPVRFYIRLDLVDVNNEQPFDPALKRLSQPLCIGYIEQIFNKPILTNDDYVDHTIEETSDLSSFLDEDESCLDLLETGIDLMEHSYEDWEKIMKKYEIGICKHKASIQSYRASRIGLPDHRHNNQMLAWSIRAIDRDRCYDDDCLINVEISSGNILDQSVSPSEVNFTLTRGFEHVCDFSSSLAVHGFKKIDYYFIPEDNGEKTEVTKYENGKYTVLVSVYSPMNIRVSLMLTPPRSPRLPEPKPAHEHNFMVVRNVALCDYENTLLDAYKDILKDKDTLEVNLDEEHQVNLEFRKLRAGNRRNSSETSIPVDSMISTKPLTRSLWAALFPEPENNKGCHIDDDTPLKDIAPEERLMLLERLTKKVDLGDYIHFHIARAELLQSYNKTPRISASAEEEQLYGSLTDNGELYLVAVPQKIIETYTKLYQLTCMYCDNPECDEIRWHVRLPLKFSNHIQAQEHLDSLRKKLQEKGEIINVMDYESLRKCNCFPPTR